MRIFPIAVVLVLGASGRVNADGQNALIGPILGIEFGGPPGTRGVFGLEGGVGLGPERVNIGFEHRAGKGFGYIELDPWLLVGASLGVGIETDGAVRPVLGLWEGVPVVGPSCDDFSTHYQPTITFALGYRYTGVHELYVSIKAGVGKHLCPPVD